jgi:hypothetical protein
MFTFNDEDNLCTVDVWSLLRMNIIVKFVAVGVSINQACQLYESVKEKTGIDTFGLASDSDVA